MLLFKLALELGLDVTALQDWLRQRNHPAHADPLARIDARTVAEARQQFAKPAPAANLAVSGLRIEGFKAFGVGQGIPLAPITLIFGPNSSGKSSVLHALLWANHAAATGELDVVRPQLSGDTVNLGSFDLMRFRREEKAMTISLDLSADQAGTPEPLRLHLSFNRVPDVDGLVEDLEERKGKKPRERKDWQDLGRWPDSQEPPSVIRLERVSIELSSRELLRASARGGKQLRIDRLDLDHPHWAARVEELSLGATFKTSLDDEVRNAIRTRLEALVPKLVFTSEGFAPGAISRDDDTPGTIESTDAFGAAVAEFPRAVEAVMRSAVEPARRWLDTLRYLGPLRTYPDRGWALSDQRDAHWLAGGGEAWDALRTSRDVRDYVNQFLAGDGSGYAFQLRDYLERTRAEDAAQEHVDELLSESHRDEEGVIHDLRDKPIDLLRTGAEQFRDIIITDLRRGIAVSPRDIGVGISQVVPVLASAYGLQEKTVLIEQPEIHVHPKLQAELGDVFLRTALFENLMRNRYIIETHSEHLVLRILRRIRQTSAGETEKNLPRVRPEDVSVIYAEPGKDGTKLHHLRITPDGDFADRWPNGFFAERNIDLFT
ncbi:MAG TPA: AAA family ATPase [Opitutaceae bacterium]|nr:AAA family ATPase [Opitutaceae bacterium]